MTEDAERALHGELHRLRDIEEIKQLRGRYCRLIDTQQWQAWADEVLAEDVTLETDGGTQEGRDVVVASVSKSLEGATTAHHCHTPEITLTGPDTATAIWAMQDHVRLPMGGSPIAFRGAGHYHEEYVRTDQGWRVRRSVLKRLSVDMLEGRMPSRPSP